MKLMEAEGVVATLGAHRSVQLSWALYAPRPLGYRSARGRVLLAGALLCVMDSPCCFCMAPLWFPRQSSLEGLSLSSPVSLFPPSAGMDPVG